MHDLQEVVAKLKEEAAELQRRIDEQRVQLVSIQELETQVNLKRRELVTLQANSDKLRENAAAGSSLFRPMPIPPDPPRKKTLILDLNGVLCKIERSAAALRQAKDLGWPLLGSCTTWVVPRSGLREFLEQVLELFCVIIWTSRTERNTELVLEALESTGCLPPGIKSGQGWGNSVKVTRDYVEEWYSVIECRDPVDELVHMFNPLSRIVQETLWRSVPSRERKLLVKENTTTKPASPPTSHPPGPNKKPPGPNKKSKNPPKHKRPKVGRDDVF
ncbi:hypothetical protein R1flu_013550 [Riccia fluitans]|uniref:Mitochondrial import inner membrane translocase subunit TIM50 n=1 Tax=Riccia fluitans TaxID=41844 RepID=A0ABD1YDK0_9MARC